jgi:hypothetical protein
VISPLPQQAAAELRRDLTLDELAVAAGHTAYLLGVLRQVGERLGVPPSHQVMTGLQGPRLWALAIRGVQGGQAASPAPVTGGDRSCRARQPSPFCLSPWPPLALAWPWRSPCGCWSVAWSRSCCGPLTGC